MLHAPLTITTAKLDISLLLKSRSPSPLPTSAEPISSEPVPPRSTSVPASTLSYPPPPSSQRTSTSSGVSAAASQHSAYPPSQTYSQPQRTYLPPLVAPASYPASHSSPRNAPHIPPHLAPAKRPPPTVAHPLASPAKKQSKWTPEEDALIIDLRGSGMKWEDISRRLPGRSAISCRLHYQNYLERRSEWDEERKNRLARLYERLKPEMWGPLAAELGIPWRAAEAMHWQLGEADMARRAGVVPFSLAATQGSSTLQPGGMPLGGMMPSGGGPLGYGTDGGRAYPSYLTEGFAARGGFVGGENVGRLGRRSAGPGGKGVSSPRSRGASLVDNPDGVVLPNLAEMERGMITFASGHCGGQQSGLGPGPVRGVYEEEEEEEE